jgi:PKHD-type hydroxylase
MLICIPEVLTKAEVAEFRSALKLANWVDGLSTAGAQAAEIKKNRQVATDCPIGAKLGAQILKALSRQPMFISAALPKTFLPPMFNAYASGETFGVHVDNAIRVVPATGERLRTDLSMTLFLSEPEEYEGGELTIETEYGAQSAKLPAGDLILYPSTSLHQVTPVTAGERVCSFFWLQSMIRDEGERTMLFDLDQTIQAISASRGAGDADAVRLTGLYHNLIRKWADL